ncbi:hypothetical protein [Paraburkholderia tropica]|uniref:hypothetical protein n=1 Tax=Paraburkholderia tropica TaxID=92647 RepID=UPI002AB00C5A|nr:hypothetical protein [Paraburkholderia tropica]
MLNIRIVEDYSTAVDRLLLDGEHLTFRPRKIIRIAGNAEIVPQSAALSQRISARGLGLFSKTALALIESLKFRPAVLRREVPDLMRVGAK